MTLVCAHTAPVIEKRDVDLAFADLRLRGGTSVSSLKLRDTREVS
jgi:hypothetical protein